MMVRQVPTLALRQDISKRLVLNLHNSIVEDSFSALGVRVKRG